MNIVSSVCFGVSLFCYSLAVVAFKNNRNINGTLYLGIASGAFTGALYSM
jgi:hypothetical protein